MPLATTPATRNLLLVDDDPEMLAQLSEGLRDAGYPNVTAESGAAALRVSRLQHFDLAILDMRMPVMSGAELAKSLLAECGCFSIILSGSNDLASVQQAMRDGALCYLVKPFDGRRLVPTIEAAILQAREIAALLARHEQLGDALREHRETGIATGVIMERLNLGRDEAYARLRDLARSQRRRVAQLAGEVVAATETVNRVGALRA